MWQNKNQKESMCETQWKCKPHIDNVYTKESGELKKDKNAFYMFF